MSVFYRGLAVYFLLVVSTSVFACYPAKISLEDRAAQAEAIYIGRVNNVIVQEKNNNLAVISTLSTLAPYALTVSVRETLKGSIDNETINVKVINCGSGGAQFGDEVVVFYSDGLWFTQVYKKSDHLTLLNLI